MNHHKIAAAPISWGVCEVPGWGYQMARERVLAEMGELGFTATEFGPEGFLPEDPAEKAELLARHGLKAVGGFVPVVLHDPEADPLPIIERELEGYRSAGAGTLVLSAATGVDGYDAERPVLDERGWETLLGTVDRVVALAAEAGVAVALHPHVGTMVETQAELDRVLAGSEVPICFDTGHMFIGGIDPAAFARDHADRVSHVHLKDVKLDRARQVQEGERSYYGAVVEGMYQPLGEGDVDIRGIVRSLRAAGYEGWFTLEQDNVVGSEPAAGEGPREEARRSVEYLRGILEEAR
ncbi:TIM barrel protein [Rothia halotolerans]|uniref:TIM barrel protein n=1 Tax=Rothia halotolerans TaxID=405770 RepID=UPI00101C8078|nr:TIM barrel protein [Rothia halotolerans]